MKRLIIFPDVFIWTKGDRSLFYNSKSFKSHIYETSESVVKAVLNRLLDVDNLYEIDIHAELNNSLAAEFVHSIVANGFGMMAEDQKSIISLPPLLNIQTQLKDRTKGQGESALLEYFSELTIHQGGGMSQYSTYYKQTFYPISSDKMLSVRDLVEILTTYRTEYLEKINIILSLIPEQKELELLIESLDSHDVSAVFYVADNNKKNILRLIASLRSSKLCDVFLIRVDSNEPDDFYLGMESCHYHFLIRSKYEYGKYCEEIKRYGLDNYSFVPIFDNNLDFFEKNIFLSEEDILSSALSKRNIFIHQSINPNYFGSLTIFPDGQIYSNVNSSPIGSLHQRVEDLIDAEMRQNCGWRVLRTDKPCSECLYQWLCPPPSNYEFVVEKSNLCLLHSN